MEVEKYNMSIAYDWSLYQREGYEAVNTSLHETYIQAISEIPHNVMRGDTIFIAVLKVKEKMFKLMEDNAHLGAMDAEPRMLLASRLVAHIKARFDIDDVGNRYYNMILY